MSGSGVGGKWMASSVKKKDIKELREAGYLAKEIAHRLPAKGQIVPTPVRESWIKGSSDSWTIYFGRTVGL